MLCIHIATALCVSRLPETKGMELGKSIGIQNGHITANHSNEYKIASEYSID